MGLAGSTRWMLRLPLRACFAAAGGLAVLATVAAGAAASPRPASATAHPGFLFGVSATSASDAWAVGFYRTGTPPGPQKTLVLHWNGTSWTRMSSPNPGTVGSLLSSVSAVSSSDVWAVGSIYTSTGDDSLALHWNGTGWTDVAVPGSGLNWVSADSATDAWAVTAGLGGGILHWDGTSWQQVTTPVLGATDTLYSISALSPTNVWAAGTHGTAGGTRTLVLHWDGTSWSEVFSPNPSPNHSRLNAVNADSPSDVWALGSYASAGTPVQTLVLHGTGSGMRRFTFPSLAGSSLDDVGAFSSSDAWVVGDHTAPTAPQTLTLHWNGTRWSQPASPSPGQDASLTRVSGISGTDLWAVGDYYDPTSQQQLTLILHWNGTKWVRT